MANVTVHSTTSSIRSSGSCAAGSGLTDSLDLRTSIKAFLFVLLARQSNSSITGNPIQVVVRPCYGDGSAERCPSDYFGRYSVTTTGNSTTSSTTMTAGTTTSITVGSATGITADSLIAIEVGTSNFEICRVSRVGGTTLYLDAPVTKNHSGTVTVTNLPEAWAIELPGGVKYEINVDFGGASAGPTYDVRILAHIHDYDVIT